MARGGGAGCQLHPAWVRSIFLLKTLHKTYREKKRHKGELGLKCTQGLGGILKENSSAGLPLCLPSFQTSKQYPLNNFTASVPVTKELISSIPERVDEPAPLLSPNTRQEATKAFRTTVQRGNNDPFIALSFFFNKKFNLRRCFSYFCPALRLAGDE